MTLRTYNLQPMSPPSINFLHITVSKMYPRKDFSGQGHYGKVKGLQSHYVTADIKVGE